MQFTDHVEAPVRQFGGQLDQIDSFGCADLMSAVRFHLPVLPKINAYRRFEWLHIRATERDADRSPALSHQTRQHPISPPVEGEF
ncbi:hypothetical protein GCM10009081_01080 [Brevundimonas nasdae]